MRIKFLNKTLIVLSLFLLALLFPLRAQNEDERPKVGLVLSGGGAKGFAHVGVLKVLEEYNIPIDYIGGTSIGAIVGALYSVGYTADQLEDMVLSQDWEALFADKPQRIYMPFYEKEEQDRYQISMRFKDGKLYIPNYALSNNGIIKLFSDLTEGYHGVDDFSQLPTPFLCVAVDFQTGNEVVIDHGFLPEAMAASMAIPGVFPNVKTDTAVFIDGGVRNNFPIDHIRDMGADIIIGVDVGAGMKTGEDLNKFSAVIDQLTTMLGSTKFESNRKDCDVYIKPDISEFTTADFTYSAAIKMIARGEQAGNRESEELKNLEGQFEGMDFPARSGYVGIESPKDKMVTKFKINGSRLEDEVILGMMGVSQETDMMCNIDQVEVGLDRLQASMRFSKVQYKLTNDGEDDEYTLTLDLEENSKNFINFGAHYNSQDNVSLLFNGTFNTLVLRNSRVSFDVKLSEIPAVDLRYNLNRGSLPGLGIKYGFHRRQMINYDNDTRVGDAYISKNYLEINTNSVVNDYFTVGLGARYESFNVNDIVGAFPLQEDNYKYLLYRFFFEIDTKDKAYYPTRGVKYYSHTDLITDNGYDLNGEVPSIVTYLGMNQSISLNNYYTLSPSMHVQVQYVTSNPPPVFYSSYVGGVNQPNDIVSQIPFWGLQWGEFKANNMVAFGLENRFQFADKHYAYLNGNVFSHVETLDAFDTNNLEYKVGVALGYSYNSLVGPIEIFFSIANSGKLRNHINIGYYF